MVCPFAPDLIVLPEACDRYGAHSTARQFDYYRFRRNQIRNYLAEEAREHRCYIACFAKREMPREQ